MCKKVIGYIALLCILIISFNGLAQNENLAGDKDTTQKPASKGDKISLLTYMRVITDSKGNVRADQNAVGNFKLISWLKLEVGLRQGERTSVFDSYYHYKIELQSKSFWKIVRVIARVSDNVVNYPSPSYRKTNKLFVVEAKYPLSKHFQVFAAGGYVFSSQQNKNLDVLPTNKGTQNNYPIFKLAIKYMVTEKAHFELAYGSYDVFNPYLLNQPFGQVTGNFELSKMCTLYTYFRYQYNNNVFTPANYFFTAGVMFHLVKG